MRNPLDDKKPLSFQNGNMVVDNMEGLCVDTLLVIPLLGLCQVSARSSKVGL